MNKMEKDNMIKDFFNHHIKYYKEEADRCKKEANRWLLALGIILIVLFCSCI